MTLSIVADGYGLDRALAAMFWRAKNGETVSYMLGLGQSKGVWRDCLICRLLGIIVEPNHCLKATAADGYPTSQPAAIRAGVLLLLYWAVIGFAPPFLLGWLSGRFL